MLKFFLILIFINLMSWLIIGTICLGCVLYIATNKELKEKIDISEYEQVCKAMPLLEKSVNIGQIISSISLLIAVLVIGGTMIWILVYGLFKAIQTL